MKKINTKIALMLTLLASSLASVVHAQQTFSISDVKEMKVSGTSTLHDWDMVAETGVEGQAIINLADKKIESIQSLSLSLNSKALKSGKSSMDKNAYEAIKADDFPKITFELTKVEEMTPSTIKAKGKLNIAGNSRDLTMTVNYSVQGNSILFSGKQDITFEQFSLEPPTAVFGTIKTGNELTLSFQAIYSTKN